MDDFSGLIGNQRNMMITINKKAHTSMQKPVFSKRGISQGWARCILLIKTILPGCSVEAGSSI